MLNILLFNKSEQTQKQIGVQMQIELKSNTTQQKPVEKIYKMYHCGRAEHQDIRSSLLAPATFLFY